MENFDFEAELSNVRHWKEELRKVLIQHKKLCKKQGHAGNQLWADCEDIERMLRNICRGYDEFVKEISKLINENNIQKAKEIILLSELCVLKHLIPDV